MNRAAALALMPLLAAALTAGAARAQDVSEPAAPRRALSHQVMLGLGVGTLSFVRPTLEGTQRLSESPFAATELVLRSRAWPQERLALDLLLAYQTSLGFTLMVEPLFALPERIGVRAQRIELSAGPVIRLGASSRAPALAFPVGFAFRWFFPEVHQYTSVRAYELGGPQLRAELIIGLGDRVRLRVGPEAQWIVLIDPELRRQGACCSGLALGGQGAIEASVGEVLRIAFAYRESHAWVPGTARFEDAERFLTARIGGAL